MNFAIIRLKLILGSFEILNYGLKPLKFQKVEDFKQWKCLDDSIKWVYLGFTHYRSFLIFFPYCICSYFFSLCGIHVSGCLHLWNVDSDVCLGSGDFLQLVLQPIWLHCYHWLRLRSVLGQLPWTRGKFWPLCPQGFEIAQSIQSYKVSIKGTPSLLLSREETWNCTLFMC